jgi:hypothetical protein
MVQFISLLFFLLNIFIYADQSVLTSARPVVTINYNLSSPDRTYILPQSLNEISGITGTDPSSIACIQDENGILFIYDLLKEQIKKQYSFYHNGDYEGIAFADKTIWILRSDGMLFEVTNYEPGNGKTVSYSTGIPAMDNEGLCFDRSANRLLVAPKSKVENKTAKKDQRFIFAFDLQSKKLIEKPAFVFDVSILKKFALENNIKLPKSKGKKGENIQPVLEFRPSAIGIHPLTNSLFVLSGVEKILFVFDMNGNIEFMKKLDSDLFLQPEGITFLKNGDMLISNEGQNKKPTILRFNYGANR